MTGACTARNAPISFFMRATPARNAGSSSFGIVFLGFMPDDTEFVRCEYRALPTNAYLRAYNQICCAIGSVAAERAFDNKRSGGRLIDVLSQTHLRFLSFSFRLRSVTAASSSSSANGPTSS
jgi:hypothetical protein